MENYERKWKIYLNQVIIKCKNKSKMKHNMGMQMKNGPCEVII